MLLGGYFSVQDWIVLILMISIAFSLTRRNPDDPTRWIPRDRFTVARWTSAVAEIAVSVFTSARAVSPVYYALSFAGVLVFLSGAVFFYAAKSPLSSILVEEEEHGASLRPAGMYRFVRHPVFFGLFLCSLGFPVYLASLPGLAFSLVFCLPLLVKSSMTVDARWAAKAGEKYEKYRSRVRLFFPSLTSGWRKGEAV